MRRAPHRTESATRHDLRGWNSASRPLGSQLYYLSPEREAEAQRKNAQLRKARRDEAKLADTQARPRRANIREGQSHSA